MSHRGDYRELVLAIQAHAPLAGDAEAVHRAARSLRRCGLALARYAEAECNTGELRGYPARHRDSLERRFAELASELGCGAKFSGDTRGYAARLIFPDGAHNTWGGSAEGWGVA